MKDTKEWIACWAHDRTSLFCIQHEAFWSIRQDYCESVLSNFPRLVNPPGILHKDEWYDGN